MGFVVLDERRSNNWKNCTYGTMWQICENEKKIVKSGRKRRSRRESR